MRNTIQSLAGGNKIAFTLIAILLLHVVYPLSEIGNVAALSFIGVYLALTGSAIYLVSSNRRWLILAVLLTIVIVVTGGITVVSDFSAPSWVQLSWSAALLIQLALITSLLVAFIIGSEAVTREVLYAAIVIYFLMATIFTVMYMVTDIFTPGAFVASSGAEITWQRLNYFSLVTISTLGYGDIVPVSGAAQSLSAMEASIGTLYIAILIGRFVSLYRHDAP